MKSRKKAPTRTRRRSSAEDAREAILAATEKRLRDVGPEGLRLQEIAKDLGISHPTVLHHVGSRDALLAAVVARSMNALENELIACFTQDDLEPLEVVATLHKIDEVMRTRGQGRLIAWLALTQPGVTKSESRLGDLTVAIHAARTALGKKAPFEDTAFGVMLATTALFGMSILGPGVLSMMGLPTDEAAQHRFRAWFGALLMNHAGMKD